MMSAEVHKALACRLYEEVFNQGYLNVLDELVTQGHINHDPTLPDVPPGPEGLNRSPPSTAAPSPTPT
jgi:hypothetical protein